MTDESPYERMLQESLKDELRLLNAHLPSEQKTLSDLLEEEYPHVTCNDGSTHLFKRNELDYLSGLLTSDKQESLLLPMIIEVNPGQNEMAVICRSEVEKDVIRAVLDMPVTVDNGRITIYGPQLSQLRKTLKTTTQYLFSPKILG